MLILARKVGERVRVLLPDGSALWIVVTEIDKLKVRLGFDCPEDVRVHREEIIDPQPRKEADRA